MSTMKIKEPKPYWAVVRLNFGTPDGMREQSFVICYIARGHVNAVRAAMRFGKDRERCLNSETMVNPFVSSMNVGMFMPGYIGSEGDYQEPKGAEFFEWRSDYPDTFEEAVEDLRKRL